MISLATLQSWTGETGSDAILMAIEAGVISFMEEHTDRLFTSPAAARSDILDGADGNEEVFNGLFERLRTAELPCLLLREEPNGATVTEVAYRDTPTSSWTAQTLSDYEVDGRQLFLLDGSYPSGRRNVKVTYTFGYAEDGGPADAHLVALQLVKHIFDRREADNLKSESIGPMRVTYQDAVEAGVAMALDALKRPILPE